MYDWILHILWVNKLHTIYHQRRLTHMKFVIQRVTNASCTVEGNITGSIQKGFLVLIGISDQDTIQIADKMIKKSLRNAYFRRFWWKNKSVLHDVNGELLLISQFTLYADCRKGNRPSFTNAGKPDMAKQMYEYIIDQCKKKFRLLNRESLALTWKFRF